MFDGEISLYADDTVVLFKGNNWKNVHGSTYFDLKNMLTKNTTGS